MIGGKEVEVGEIEDDDEEDDDNGGVAADEDRKGGIKMLVDPASAQNEGDEETFEDEGDDAEGDMDGVDDNMDGDEGGKRDEEEMWEIEEADGDDDDLLRKRFTGLPPSYMPPASLAGSDDDLLLRRQFAGVPLVYTPGGSQFEPRAWPSDPEIVPATPPQPPSPSPPPPPRRLTVLEQVRSYRPTPLPAPFPSNPTQPPAHTRRPHSSDAVSWKPALCMIAPTP